MLDHADGAKAPVIGGRRIRYGWQPVRQCITLTRPGARIWLLEVFRTLCDGWVAFEHDNRGGYALTMNTALLGTAGNQLIAFAAASVTLGPPVADLPPSY